jgi:ceramide glucosyltransferase
MTPDLALQSLSPAMRFRDYWTRRLRWIRIRKHTEPAATLLEPLTESVFLGALLGVACVMVGFDWKNVLLWYFGIWALEDLAIALWLGFAGLPQAKWKLLLAYLVRELLAFPLWVAGVSGSSIDWRGKRFRVGRGGEAVPLDLDDDSVVEPREANGHLNGTELANGMNGHAGNGIKARLRKR